VLQEKDGASQLAVTRPLLALRNAHPALRLGALEKCEADGGLLTFDRVAAGIRIHCLFNLSDEPIDLLAPVSGTPILAINGATSAQLPGYGALYVAG
jgi:alpha-glucosidase